MRLDLANHAPEGGEAGSSSAAGGTMTKSPTVAPLRKKRARTEASIPSGITS